MKEIGIKDQNVLKMGKKNAMNNGSDTAEGKNQ